MAEEGIAPLSKTRRKEGRKKTRMVEDQSGRRSIGSCPPRDLHRARVNYPPFPTITRYARPRKRFLSRDSGRRREEWGVPFLLLCPRNRWFSGIGRARSSPGFTTTSRGFAGNGIRLKLVVHRGKPPRGPPPPFPLRCKCRPAPNDDANAVGAKSSATIFLLPSPTIFFPILVVRRDSPSPSIVRLLFFSSSSGSR